MSTNRSDPECRGRAEIKSALLFSQLVALHDAQLRRLCRRYSRDADEEDDLVQTTWIAAWDHRGQYRGDGSFAGWLMRLARTVCLKDLRRRLSMLEIDSIANLAAPLPADFAAAAAEE